MLNGLLLLDLKFADVVRNMLMSHQVIDELSILKLCSLLLFIQGLLVTFRIRESLSTFGTKQISRTTAAFATQEVPVEFLRNEN